MTRERQGSDVELLEQWRAGESAAGEQLFRRHYAAVECFLRNKVGPGQVSDLVQQSFMVCLESRDRIENGARFRCYLLTIAYRVFCAHLRERYREAGVLDLEQVSVAALDPSPSSVAARSREKRLLLEGLRHISIDHQVMLELHYWEQLKTLEIAEVLGLPAGTVRGRLQRARQSLEAAMTRLARSPALLSTTLTRLDDWAMSCRADLDIELEARA